MGKRARPAIPACSAAAWLQAAKISQKPDWKNCTRVICSCFRKGGCLASPPLHRQQELARVGGDVVGDAVGMP